MYRNKSVLALIPARGGSKGIPRKNLRIVKGKSLLAHTIDVAKQSQWIDRIVVSSEDQEIIVAARRAGADVPFVRPHALAQDETPGVEPVVHALKHLPHYDYVILLQVTSPLRTVHDIDGSIERCILQRAPACVSVTKANCHPHWMFSMNEAQQLKPLLTATMPTRRQDLPETFILNGAIYVAETDWFLVHKSFLSAATIAYVMPEERSLDIDTEMDFKLFEMQLNHYVC